MIRGIQNEKLKMKNESTSAVVEPSELLETISHVLTTPSAILNFSFFILNYKN